MPGTILNVLWILILTLNPSLMVQVHDSPYFSEKETEAQTTFVTCPKATGQVSGRAEISSHAMLPFTRALRFLKYFSIRYIVLTSWDCKIETQIPVGRRGPWGVRWPRTCQGHTVSGCGVERRLIHWAQVCTIPTLRLLGWQRDAPPPTCEEAPLVKVGAVVTDTWV